MSRCFSLAVLSVEYSMSTSESEAEKSRRAPSRNHREASLFFYVEQNPVSTFKSTKIVKTGHETYEVDGDFTIRGVSNPEKMTLCDPRGCADSAGVNPLVPRSNPSGPMLYRDTMANALL
jgi:polyisoprenoid-binding protein YceI